MLPSLEADELSLIQAIESGDFREFDRKEGASGPTLKAEIRGQVLLHIVRGFALPISPYESRPVRVGSAGIQFSFAKVTGEINLNDITGPNGSPFPRLRMENCSFEQTIHLERSHLQSLSLRYSRFKCLNASDARIKGPIDLRCVRGIDDEQPERSRQCWVILATAVIAGRVSAAGAHFVAPQKRGNLATLSQQARYALDLRLAHIKSSLHLRPNCVAIGGICLKLANIDGSVWLNGAELEAGEESAFAADYATIRGSLYLRPNDRPPEDQDEGLKTHKSMLHIEAGCTATPDNMKEQKGAYLHAEGCVSLFACKLGGSLNVEGARIHVPKDRLGKKTFDDRVMLDARSVQIGGFCNLGCWQSEVTPTTVYQFATDGDICLDSARIKNHLSFAGARVKAVYARNAQVGGNCDFSVFYSYEHGIADRFTSEGDVNLRGIAIKGDLDFRGALIGIPGQDRTTLRTKRGNGAEDTDRSIFCLSGSSIGGNCHLSAFQTKCNENDRDYKRGIRFKCNGNILFTESRITNSLNMDGAWLQAHREEPAAALDLSGTVIGGEASLKTWHSQGARSSLPFVAQGGRVVLELVGTRISQGLILNGARIIASRMRPSSQNTVSSSAQIPKKKSVYALKAVNATIEGKVSLSSFRGQSSGAEKCFRFASRGPVSFATATVNLGFDLEGSNLHAIAPPWNRDSIEGSLGDPMLPWREDVSETLALDLGRAHLKSVSLGLDSWENPCEVSGQLCLKHTRIDNDLRLIGARLHGPLDAEGIRVGFSVNLEGTSITARSVDAAISHAYCDARSKGEIEERVQQKHIERTLRPDISLNNGVVGNELKVTGLIVHFPTRRNALNDFDKGGKMRHATIDLRGLNVGELADQAGEGWGTERTVRLWLDGFRYRRLPEVVIPNPDPPKPLRLLLKTFSKRLGNPSWIPSGVRNAASEDPPQLGAGPAKGIAALLFYWQDKLESRLQRPEAVWERRLRWLGLQYFDPDHPTLNEYSPDAYEQLVSGLNSAGNYKDARRISSARLTLEVRWKGPYLPHWKVNPRPIWRGTIWLFLKGPSWLIWRLFRIFFDYGFSVARALITFALALALGMCAAKVADRGLPWSPNYFGDVLILNEGSPETRVADDGKGRKIPYPLEMGRQAERYEAPIPCGDAIDPNLYAVDVFIPVLNLHQQDVCSINPVKHSWGFAEAAYGGLGWIVTSLTILTMSGILRKHIEK